MQFKVNTIETAPEASVRTLQDVEKGFGFIPNLMGIFAESPEILDAYLKVSNLFDSTSFSAEERQIVLLATSVENSCEYCVAAHTVISDLQKVPKGTVEAIRAGESLSDPKLEALRVYAADLAKNRGFASEESTKAFFEAGYDTRNALEVVLGIAQKTLSNYANHIANTPLDEQFRTAKWEALDGFAAAA